ncbi:MAG: hypothetical protein B6D46_07505 [Polyangiaceae bacterium UTPRO1]|jgi:hypothetical protein|nr:L-2-amino-thiazoline-4-carboxylic acid hydrolase [Myxococcales bacterium]OQY67188.1 MAG: hypothetical protein B6D46_07505 [Polyangiaceae bacterium UTPRO1]
MESLSYLERVKIQSEILLPFFRRVRQELGAARADELLRAAVQEFAAGLAAAAAENAPGSSLDKLRSLLPMFAAGEALDMEPLVDDARELSLDVRGCRYAEHFRALGEPEFGAMVTCELDPILTRALGADLTLERTQTIMQGGSHCDFRWRLE